MIRIMIESGHSLPDLRDVEEYHDDRKIEKIYRRFRYLNNPVSNSKWYFNFNNLLTPYKFSSRRISVS